MSKTPQPAGSARGELLQLRDAIQMLMIRIGAGSLGDSLCT
jgi:hypothetical protein